MARNVLTKRNPRVNNFNTLMKRPEVEGVNTLSTDPSLKLQPTLELKEPFTQPVTLGTSPTPVPQFTAQPESAFTPPTTAVPTNVLTTPKDTHSQYWGQPMSKKFNMPLDQFVRMAGMTAHAFDPTGPAGILGKDLSAMGAEAYGERARREYAAPNELLRRQLLRAQIKTIEEKAPPAWDIYFKQQDALGVSRDKIVENYAKLQRAPVKPTYKYIQDNEGNVSIFADGVLQPGSAGKGKGKDITKEIKSHEIDDKGNITFFNKQGDIIKEKVPGGKTKTTPSSMLERAHKEYLRDFETAKTKGQAMPVNAQGLPFTLTEYIQHMQPKLTQYQTEDGTLVYANEYGGFSDTDGAPLPAGTKVRKVAPPETDVAKRLREYKEKKEGKSKEKEKVTPTKVTPSSDFPVGTLTEERTNATTRIRELRKIGNTGAIEEVKKVFKVRTGQEY